MTTETITDAEAFEAWLTLERWRASLLSAKLGSTPSVAHYYNGRAPHLPGGWSLDRYLRWCRDRLSDGAVRVVVDGKIRRVLCAELDAWLAAQSRARRPKLALVEPQAVENVDDVVARELGLRTRSLK